MSALLLRLENEKPLKDLTTFGIGGPAKYFLEVRSVEEMQQALLYCRQEEIRYIILGKGSNCLFDDKGFNGMVILNKVDCFENLAPGLFYAGSGYSFSRLGTQTARLGYSGLEFASGIPGSVGGAVFMNAGANGKETCDSLLSVDFINEKGEMISFPKKKLHFSYRRSSFQEFRGAIAGASFQLLPLSSARKKQIDIISYRKKTQPYSRMSAGCVFRNPASKPAGVLIDCCGLKGMRIGGAEVSSLHGNFIINRGNAKSEEVLSLIQAIREKVKSETGFELESEIRFISYEEKQ